MRSPAPSFPPPDFCSTPPLPLSFYLRDTVDTARALLGKGLFLLQKGIPLLVRIVEVEAYLSKDESSHSYRGLTQRNWPMFESGGTCYVYLSYGVNYCMNVVTREKGCGEAVLLRAATPLIGIEVMQINRKNSTVLLNGPGKLTQGLGIDLSYNGLTFDRQDFRLIDLGYEVRAKEIGASPRIGISKARTKPLRFFIKSSPDLSRKG